MTIIIKMTTMTMTGNDNCSGCADHDDADKDISDHVAITSYEKGDEEDDDKEVDDDDDDKRRLSQ